MKEQEPNKNILPPSSEKNYLKEKIEQFDPKELEEELWGREEDHKDKKPDNDKNTNSK